MVWLIVFNTTFNNISAILCQIVAVSFIGGGNRGTQRKPRTCRKSLTNVTPSVSCAPLKVHINFCLIWVTVFTCSYNAVSLHNTPTCCCFQNYVYMYIENKFICTFNGAHDTEGVTKKFKVDGLAYCV
jgi:hypothetical protein